MSVTFTNLTRKMHAKSKTNEIIKITNVIMCLLLSLSLCFKVNCYSSAHDLEMIVKSEAKLIEIFDQYDQFDQEQDMREFVDSLKQEHEQIGNDINGYVSVPINAYRLIKRLTKNQYFSQIIRLEPNEVVQNFIEQLPTNEDFDQILESLERLQNIYELDANSLSNGFINKKQYSKKMTSSECFELAELFYEYGFFYLAIQWFEAGALRQLDMDYEILEKTEHFKIVTLYKIKIFEKIPYYNFVTYFDKFCCDLKYKQNEIDELSLKYLSQIEDYNNTLTAKECYENGLEVFAKKKWIHTILWMVDALERMDVDNYKFDALVKTAQAAANLRNYNYALEFLKELTNATEDYPNAINLTNEYKDKMAKGESVKGYPFNEQAMNTKDCYTYSRLCRGVESRPIKALTPLRCKYFNNKQDPFLLLAPFKMEEVHMDPYIVLFHRVISDNEIDVVKKLAIASSDFVESGMIGKTHKLVIKSKQRVSKNGWLWPGFSEVVDKLSQRVHDITKANLSVAEALQVANYGPGGHYSPHHDYFGEKLEPGYSDRLATFIFYLSDVEEGGATVFTLHNVTIFPQKGSGILWYNLKNGTGNKETLHAGCPVVVGSKWIANKWLHEDEHFSHQQRRF